MKHSGELKRKIREAFTISPETKAKMDSGNMFIGLIVSPIMILIAIAFIAVDVFIRRHDVLPKFFIIGQVFIYLLLIGSSIFLFSVSCRYLKNKKVSKKKIHFSVYLFVILNYLFAAYIAIEDFLSGSHFYSFLAVAMIMPVLFYLRPADFILFTICSFYLVFKSASEFISKKNYLNPFTNIDIVNIVEMVLLIIIFCFIRLLEKNRSSRIEVEMQTMNSDLHKLSYYDALTGLKNRYALREDYESYVGKNVFAMMLDVDDFKFFNDNFGHNVGDEILKKLSESLKIAFSVDYCYRFGGDEILVICPQADEADFKNTIIAWRAVFNEVETDGQKLKCSCSCGYIFGMVESQADLRRMIQLADGQLYEAKRRGKNCEVGKSYISALYDKTGENIYSKVEHKDSSVDPLTGLSTMMQFRNKAWLIVHNNSDENSKFCFIYFNIVNFKSFNEIHGFSEGDQLIVDIADELKKSFTRGLIARFAEDHFVVLTDLENIEKKLNAISDVIYSKWSVRVKAGVYYDKDMQVDITSACDRAKLACDNIKTVHGANYKFFDEKLKEQTEKKHYIVENFNTALKDGSIKVYYQPVVDAENRRIQYVEALARWNDTKYGEFSPKEFIPVLEDAHLINVLDLYVIESVASAYNTMPTESRATITPVSVNISYIDFILCNMHELIDGIMEKYSVPHDLVCFEIKEKEFQKNQDMLNIELSILRENGYKTWLDDFGSGYLPLNILDECQFDVIKIDVAFLDRFYNSKKLKIIISHITRIAMELDIKILARGIENEDQYALFQDFGCDFIQGYLISKPMPIEQLLEFK